MEDGGGAAVFEGDDEEGFAVRGFGGGDEEETFWADVAAGIDTGGGGEVSGADGADELGVEGVCDVIHEDARLAFVADEEDGGGSDDAGGNAFWFRAFGGAAVVEGVGAIGGVEVGGVEGGGDLFELVAGVVAEGDGAVGVDDPCAEGAGADHEDLFVVGVAGAVWVELAVLIGDGEVTGGGGGGGGSLEGGDVGAEGDGIEGDGADGGFFVEAGAAVGGGVVAVVAFVGGEEVGGAVEFEAGDGVWGVEGADLALDDVDAGAAGAVVGAAAIEAVAGEVVEWLVVEDCF